MRRYYYQCEDGGILSIVAKRKPSLKTSKGIGFVVREHHVTEWVMPCFPQITWGILNKQKYIGSLPYVDSQEN